MMNKNVVSRLLCAGLSVSMMLSMGSVVFADDDWTIDVEAMKEEAAAKDNKDIKLAYVSMNLANPWKIFFNSTKQIFQIIPFTETVCTSVSLFLF